MISNVRVLGGSEENFKVTSNFVTYRSKGGVTETYLGHHLYDMCLQDGEIRIKHKRSFIDTDDINEQGKVSIII